MRSVPWPVATRRAEAIQGGGGFGRQSRIPGRISPGRQQVPGGRRTDPLQHLNRPNGPEIVRRHRDFGTCFPNASRLRGDGWSELCLEDRLRRVRVIHQSLDRRSAGFQFGRREVRPRRLGFRRRAGPGGVTDSANRHRSTGGSGKCGDHPRSRHSASSPQRRRTPPRRGRRRIGRASRRPSQQRPHRDKRHGREGRGWRCAWNTPGRVHPIRARPGWERMTFSSAPHLRRSVTFGLRGRALGRSGRDTAARRRSYAAPQSGKMCGRSCGPSEACPTAETERTPRLACRRRRTTP